MLRHLNVNRAIEYPEKIIEKLIHYFYENVTLSLLSLDL
jgi:hypothetical protein